MECKKIVIVEDEAIVSNDLKDILKRLNYEIIDTFYKGEDLLNKIKNRSYLPDVILMDINLKGQVDGITAAKEIKEIEAEFDNAI